MPVAVKKEAVAELGDTLTVSFGRLTAAVPDLPELPGWAPGAWAAGLFSRLVDADPAVRVEAALAVFGLKVGAGWSWLGGELGRLVACAVCADGVVRDIGVMPVGEVPALVGRHRVRVQNLVNDGRFVRVARGQVSVGSVAAWIACHAEMR